ncbi:MAG: hypothetical protein H6574_06400 [Lewinellaceae bacterium]|nr:hypothetical protein [Lewinellaceae bacterium]
MEPVPTQVGKLTNHLGNVLAVITDRKRGLAASGKDIQWYEADVMATQQYYPFGMLMPTSTDSSLRRQYSLNEYDYRYGFNGKEGDDEIKGDDNQQDYGMRIYDPRVGRFLSVDPIAREYPWYTPYQFAGNKPIWAFDLDGLEDVKWEYSKSDQFIGGQGMSKEDKAVYQEAFDEIIDDIFISVASELVGAGAFSLVGKGYKAFAKTAKVATKSASQTPKSIAKDLSTTEQTITKSKQVVKNAENGANAAKGGLTSFDDVARYVSKSGKLPSNYITKAQAKNLGWNPKLGNLDVVAPGKSIGGDIFKNSEGLLPKANGRTWIEADINYSSGFRGSERLIYSNDGLIYKTTDHYKTFTQIK